MTASFIFLWQLSELCSVVCPALLSKKVKKIDYCVRSDNRCAGTRFGKKEWLKRRVFQCFLKQTFRTPNVTFCGRGFPQSGSSDRKSSIADDWKTCVGQQAMMSKQSGDADELRQQMTGGIPQRGTAELSGVGCLYTRTASLNSMRSSTFSQCSCVMD